MYLFPPSLSCFFAVTSYKYTFYSLYPLFCLVNTYYIEYHAWASLLTSQWLQQTIKLIEFWCLICSNANPKSSQGKGCHEFLATFIWFTAFIRTSQILSENLQGVNVCVSFVHPSSLVPWLPPGCAHLLLLLTGVLWTVGCKTENRNS